MLNKIPAYVLSISVIAAILYLTLAPQPLPDNDLPLFPNADKVVHALMFGGAFFCFYTDRLKLRGKVSGLAILMLMIATVIFGGAVEILQDAMGLGRGGDILDFLADIAGVFLSALITPAIYRKATVR